MKIRPLLFALLLPTLIYAQQPSKKPEENFDITLTSLEPEHARDDIPFEALKTFVDVFDTVKNNYVEAVDNQTLIENAIRGMLARLDPHSAYMNEKEFQEFEQQSEGQYAGIGVVLDIKAGSMRVVSAIEGSPAARAGIQSGDIIAQVNGQNVSDLTLSETDKLLDGPEGSEVKLIIQRGDSLTEYTLSRAIISTSSISSQVFDNQYAYLRISQFQDDTTDALEKEITALRVKHDLRGAVIDLRNNPGGYLDSAIATADLFLDQGTILFIRGRNSDQDEEYLASPGDVLAGLPIVVLVDEGSASGAEILAGALQDNKRALIVGQPTFGKGSVQTITPLYHGGAVKMTTARYYTPSGASIQARGIIPQVILTPLRVQQDDATEINNRESALPYHLTNPSAVPPPNTGNNNDLAKQDFALYEALNILKTMAILQPPPPAPSKTPPAENKPTTKEKPAKTPAIVPPKPATPAPSVTAAPTPPKKSP